MANYVDELRLGIKVDDNKSGEKVRNLANAISRLNKVIVQLDPALLKSTFGVLRREMGGLAKEAKSAEKALMAAANVLRGGGIAKAVKEAQKATAEAQKTSTDTIAKGIERQTKDVDIVATPFREAGKRVDYKSELEFYKAQEADLASKVNDVNLSYEKRVATQKKLYAVQKKIASLSKNATIQDLLRIARYRLIRTLLSQLTKGIKEFLDSAAQQSPEVNKNLSSITSSLAVLQSSLGAIVTALLPALQPLLVFISTVIGVIANGLSLTISALMGQGKYLKINTRYWQEYNKAVQGTLLSFDTFNTLSVGSDKTDLTSEEDTTFSWENLGSSLLGIGATAGLGFLFKDKIAGVVEGLGNVFSKTKDIKDATEGVANATDKVSTDVNTNVPDGLDKATTKAKNFKSAMVYASLAVGGLVEFLSGLTLVLDENVTGAKKVFAVIQMIAGGLAVVAGTIAAIMAVVKPLSGWTTALKITTIAATAIAGVSGIVGSYMPKTYANGGMLDGAGTMYAIAGESGAEVVAQGSAGTGVLNVLQFRQAMVEALYEYGAARGQLDSISVNMDGNSVGRVVAGSNGFRSEAHRRGNGWR